MSGHRGMKSSSVEVQSKTKTVQERVFMQVREKIRSVPWRGGL